MSVYSDDELLDYLKQCKSKHDEVSHTKLNDDDELPSGPTYNYRFGSLSNALEKVNLTDEANSSRMREGRRTTAYSVKEIAEYLNKISEDGEISRKMVVQSDGPTHQTICRHSNDSTLSGFVENNTNLEFVEEYRRKIRSKSEVMDGLKEADENNKYISQTLLSSSNYYPSMDEVIHHFGSLEDAAEELDLKLYDNNSTIGNYLGEHYLYVLSVCKSGDDMFYVGETKNILSRLSAHSSSNSFDINYIDRIIHLKDSENALDEERKLSLKIAQEYDTTNIIGGK